MRDRYRELLRNELVERCDKRPGYSLRAFARDLNLDPAQLSRVLSGTKNLSSVSAQAIAEKLFKTTKQRQLFIAAVEYTTAKKPELRSLALKKISKVAGEDRQINLTLEAMRVISDWYHFAILDLVGIPAAPQTNEGIAKYLGISELEAKLAIERMTELGLLEKKRGKLVKTSAKLATPTDTPSQGLRQFHRQMMTKAIESLETQPVADRYIVGKTMSIRRGDLPKLKDIIEDFMSRVSEVVQSASTGVDSLYQLNVQLFDLRRRK